jgi:uncharacterized iron-regulated membrane protein
VAFSAELDALQFPQLMRVTPAGSRLPLQKLFDVASDAKPGVEVYGAQLDRDPARSVELYYEKDEKYGAVFVDPYTGRVLGSVDQDRALSRVLLRLHYTLLLSPWGDLVIALVGIAFLGSAMTGLWVYRTNLLMPFRRGVEWNRGTRVVSKQLHTLVGLATIAFNVILGVSGVYLMLYAFTPGYLTGEDERLHKLEQKAPKGLPTDEILARALQAMPGMEAQGVYLADHVGDPARVYGQMPGTPFWLGGNSYGRSYVEIDGQTGRVLYRMNINEADAATRFETLLYELHFGQFGGWPVKTLYAAIGLTPGLLSITGFILWWKRRARVRVLSPASPAPQPARA